MKDVLIFPVIAVIYIQYVILMLLILFLTKTDSVQSS